MWCNNKAKKGRTDFGLDPLKLRLALRELLLHRLAQGHDLTLKAEPEYGPNLQLSDVGGPGTPF